MAAKDPITEVENKKDLEYNKLCVDVIYNMVSIIIFFTMLRAINIIEKVTESFGATSSQLIIVSAFFLLAGDATIKAKQYPALIKQAITDVVISLKRNNDEEGKMLFYTKIVISKLYTFTTAIFILTSAYVILNCNTSIVSRNLVLALLSISVFLKIILSVLNFKKK